VCIVFCVISQFCRVFFFSFLSFLSQHIMLSARAFRVARILRSHSPAVNPTRAVSALDTGSVPFEKIPSTARLSQLPQHPASPIPRRIKTRELLRREAEEDAKKERSRVVHRRWHLFDAYNQPLGRIASTIAKLLAGKHKPSFTPNRNNGDMVVVVNTNHVRLTGKKWQKKLYRHHSGHPGGLKEITAERLHAKFPTRLLEKAVYGMLPRNRHRKPRMGQLQLFSENEHPYAEMFSEVDMESMSRMPHDEETEVVMHNMDESELQEMMSKWKEHEEAAEQFDTEYLSDPEEVQAQVKGQRPQL
jgi:large subunit ribosomal protein L13